MVAQMLLAFGLIFELPVLAYLLGRLGIIDANTLLKYGRHAIVGIFVVAAILTPPDVLSQLLMAGPMLALYGLSILILKLTTTPVAPKQRSDKNL
jgi:sec-independent protein translocase protein TatC